MERITRYWLRPPFHSSSLAAPMHNLRFSKWITSDRDLASVDSDRPWRSLARMFAPHKLRVVGAFFAFAAKDSPIWLLPSITAGIIDAVSNHGPIRSLEVLGLFGIVILGQNYPTSVAFTALFSSSYRMVGRDLRNALAARLQFLSIGAHSRLSAGLIQSKLVRDVENIELMLQQVVPDALSAVLVLVGAIVTTAIRIPQFVWVYALAVPIAAALWAANGRKSASRNLRFREEVENFSARVSEMATLIPITRAHGVEEAAQAVIAESSEGLRAAGLRLDRLNGGFNALTWMTLQVAGLACLVFAGAAAIKGWLPITPGEVVLLGSYFTLLTAAVGSLLALLPIITKGRESIRSVGEIFASSEHEGAQGTQQLEPVEGRIDIVDVCFRFPRSLTPSLSDVDLRVAAGETIAIVGPSGSGKSTLMNLVLGLMPPSSGRISIDDVDLTELDLRSLRRSISVVPQESVLFEASIRENITYGLTAVSDERVLDALSNADAMDFVSAFPEKWDTRIGPGGVSLSGGQRQRLSIARALVRDPRILLLDEPTSALDPVAEREVTNALSKLMVGRTSLIIAHRLGTIRTADRVVVMESGRITEVGPHAELIKLGGGYAKLLASQLSDGDD